MNYIIVPIIIHIFLLVICYRKLDRLEKENQDSIKRIKNYMYWIDETIKRIENNQIINKLDKQ